MPALLLGSISTIADTSELQREAFNSAFKAHGLDWDWSQEEYRDLLTGNGGAQRIADYAAARGEDVDADAVHATKSEHFQAALAERGASARPGVAETVAAAREHGYKVALVTTTAKENVAALADALRGELDVDGFDLLVDTDDVQAGKPDPAAYRFALDRLGERAQDAVAVEDNEGGVEAARAAGVPVVAFPNENTAAAHDFSGADGVVERLAFSALPTAA
jgi:HAD superfamily hydrolase (TIGR01509 family)